MKCAKNPSPTTKNATLTEMNKSIACVNAESGEIINLDITPGTTVTDALRQLNVQGDRSVTVNTGQAPIKDSAHLYGAVEDGQKVYFSTPISVATLN